MIGMCKLSINSIYFLINISEQSSGIRQQIFRITPIIFENFRLRLALVTLDQILPPHALLTFTFLDWKVKCFTRHKRLRFDTFGPHVLINLMCRGRDRRLTTSCILNNQVDYWTYLTLQVKPVS